MPSDRPPSPPTADASALLEAVLAPLMQLDGGGFVVWRNAAAKAWLPVEEAGSFAALWTDADAARALLQGADDRVLWAAGDSDVSASASAKPLPGGGWLVTLQPLENQPELLLARAAGRTQSWRRLIDPAAARDDTLLLRQAGLLGGPGDGSGPALDVVDEDRRTLATRLRDSLSQPGRHGARFRIHASDGRLRRIHLLWSVPVRDGAAPLALHGLALDDSEAFALAYSSSELESQLALALEVGGISVWRHDIATGRMQYSAQGWATLGRTPRPEGLSLDEVRELIHPDDLPRVMASAEAALRTNQPVDVEARYRHADGSWRPQLLRRVVQRDASGRATAFMGVALDLTERQEQRRRAEELRRRFETVTRAAGIGHWLQEPGQERPIWSDEMRAMFGLQPDTPAPTMRQWLQEHVHPDDVPLLRRAMQDWLASGASSVDFDFRARRPDGSVRQLFSHSKLEAGTGGPVLFGVVIDITERRRSELALKNAQERVALVARGIGLGTWELDLENGAVHWDEPMWRLRGHEPRPQAMTPAERLACVHPDDRHRTQQPLDDAMAGGLPFEHEFRVIWPDGSLRWIASRSMEIHDADSGRRRRIGVNWDITDSRTAETVRQQREIALRESASKSKFLARMSHELRTPLNAVLGFAQLLLSDENGTDAASLSRRRRLDHIRSAGQHLLTLINDVLDLSGVEGGEVRIAREPVALAPLLHRTLPMLSPLQADNGVRIELGMLEGQVLGDATRLRQVLLNLLSNAIKYNRPGGLVRVDAQREGDRVRLRVADTGRGMTPEQLAQLFEPFNRLGADRGSVQGSGIGLAIVKALVQRMGGSLAVRSEHGQGSVFELLLDAADEGPSHDGSFGDTVAGSLDAGPVQGGPVQQHSVLYVEDNPVNALIIAELVGRRSDLALHVATDGASGVAMARSLRPDLILLDMQLPDFDGYEVLRRLRAEPGTAGIPCIALSANAMPADIERALGAGMADYWTKPLDFKAFMASLDALFGKAR